MSKTASPRLDLPELLRPKTNAVLTKISRRRLRQTAPGEVIASHFRKIPLQRIELLEVTYLKSLQHPFSLLLNGYLEMVALNRKKITVKNKLEFNSY